MEPYVQARFSQSILEQITQCYPVKADSLRELDAFESFIYEYSDGAHDRILRISHSDRRSEALIHGEVDWINYLADGGASVAQAVYSQGGNLIEAVDDQHGGQFLATAFVKAPGKSPGHDQWTPALYERYGKLLGKMHALTKAYHPANPDWKRPTWNDEALMLNLDDWLPASETIANQKFQQILEHLESLPHDKNSYGLIHQDAHGGNFFVDEDGTITLFDFDDCVYGWFVYDIAMVLFYAALWQADKLAFTQNFMTHFLRGYWQENQIEPVWFKEIPYFLKLREIDLYAVIHRDFDVENMDDAWNIGYMTNRKYKIENDIPFIDFEFELLTDIVAEF